LCLSLGMEIGRAALVIASVRRRHARPVPIGHAAVGAAEAAKRPFVNHGNRGFRRSYSCVCRWEWNPVGPRWWVHR